MQLNQSTWAAHLVLRDPLLFWVVSFGGPLKETRPSDQATRIGIGLPLDLQTGVGDPAFPQTRVLILPSGLWVQKTGGVKSLGLMNEICLGELISEVSEAESFHRIFCQRGTG